VAGEIPIHPELLGHLHFDVPSRTTLPLGPEDFRRFLPEMQRSGMQSAFPLSTSDLSALQREQEAAVAKQVRRQKSYKEPSFSSLQHEDLKKGKKKGSRSQSTENRGDKKFRPFSMFQSSGAGWFNPGYVLKEGGQEIRNNKDKQHWYMKEKNMQSLPSLGSTPDSGLVADEENRLNRGDKERSSFGMILKDKFQKNPNMYFPDTRAPSRSPDYKARKGKAEDLSDTDTLIHNMSEGSFDKDSSLSGGRSIGSRESNRSSGKSSSLSHDSINGTPEMKRRSESITTPKKLSSTAVHLPSNPSVILNKKTIRNYTPKESSNMLRQFEEGRHNSLDKRSSRHKTNSPDSRQSSTTPDTDNHRKSSMDKLIDDFHRNLPPPSKAESVSPFSDVDSMFSGSALESNLPSLPLQPTHKSKMGTVTSQTSHWSVASSVASFDYHTTNNHNNNSTHEKKTSSKTTNKSKDTSAAAVKRRISSSTTNLPALSEADSREDLSGPREERIPPEGAASDSPAQFIQRIEVKGDAANRKTSSAEKSKPPRRTGKETAREEVKDLLEDKDDELVMLRKLISEGRIAGLNEKPPTFKPPTPPSKAAAAKKAKAPVPNSSSPKTPQVGGKTQVVTRNSEVSKTPEVTKTPSGDRPRKAREAPAPPEKFKPPPETADIKFIGGRRIHSVEDLQEAEGRDWRGERVEREGRREQKSDQVQRSTSMHMPKDARGDEVDSVAQLIADSTERKFKINNIFKGMWKKKHYSFDLS